MPFLELPTHRMHYQIQGRDDAPWLMFCNSLGTDLSMWNPQAAELAGHFRILRYDRRGHGQSGTPAGAYTVDQLGCDVLALWDALGIDNTHFCGLSIGGLTGQWLALHAPGRVDKLVLCATAASIGQPDAWAARAAAVLEQGLEPLAEGTASRWFTEAFADCHEQQVHDILERFLQVDPVGYAGCCNAVGTADFRGRLGAIEVPVLAIAGNDDPVCPPTDLQYIARSVADGRFAGVGGRHICNIESAADFNRQLLAFLRA